MIFQAFNTKDELEYSGGPVISCQPSGKDCIIIHPDEDECSNYEIYWHFPGDRFMHAGTEIRMKKTGSKYRLKRKVPKYDEQKGKYFIRSQIAYYIEM